MIEQVPIITMNPLRGINFLVSKIPEYYSIIFLLLFIILSFLKKTNKYIHNIINSIFSKVLVLLSFAKYSDVNFEIEKSITFDVHNKYNISTIIIINL